MTKRDDGELKIAHIPPFGLRMMPELKQRVEAEARANGRSLNSEIIARLEWSLETDGGDFAFAANAQSSHIKFLENEFGRRLAQIEDRLAKLEAPGSS
jgi:hypothetical protein